MSDIINYLQQRIEEAKRKHQEAHERIQQLAAERETLAGDIQGYERTLAALRRDQGIKVPAPPVQTILSSAEGDDAGISKAEFARQFVRKHGETGVTPNDIFKGFMDAEIPINKPYIYALVQRLQKSKPPAIKAKRGKWYPALESEQSANGTAEKVLP